MLSAPRTIPVPPEWVPCGLILEMLRYGINLKQMLYFKYLNLIGRGKHTGLPNIKIRKKIKNRIAR